MRLSRSLALCLAAPLLAAPNDSTQKEWISLFNGRDLTHWIAKIKGYPVGENFGDTFRVENGALKVSYDAYDRFDDRFGHLFYDKPFSHYVIAAEYRFTGEQANGGAGWATRNSGIMVHSQPPSTMLKDQNFPISIEVQLLGGLGKGPRSTANLCTPGTHVVMQSKLIEQHCISSASSTFDGDQWVRAEVEVLGNDRITHRVNGQAVLTYDKPQVGGGAVTGFDPAVKRDGKMLHEGYISLQSESHPIEFRKVELLNLSGCTDKKAKNYKAYFVHSDPRQCR